MYRTPIHRPLTGAGWLLLAALALAGQSACAQATSAPPPALAGTPASDAPLYSAEAIAELVAPVALYPDDLLAIVLPASTYPLQIVQAQRFLDALAGNPALQPDETWDDSVVALLNYPEVIELMNHDLDWTAELGQAVLAQQPEVIAAIEGFRRRAFTAGNLKSDDRQVVEVSDDAVYVRPADPKVIYVPYYDPAVVTVYRPRPVYSYHPRPYPVYYYPYPVGYTFASGFFWGVTSYFALGWNSHHLHVYHHDYYDHPYYGRPHLYHTRHYYYRRAPKVVNNYYIDADRDRYDHDRHDRKRDRRDYDHDRYDREPWSGRDDRNHQRYRDRNERAETYWRRDYRRAGDGPGATARRKSQEKWNRTPRPRSEELAASAPGAAVGSSQFDGQAPASLSDTDGRADSPQSVTGGDRGRPPAPRADLDNAQPERAARSRAENRPYRNANPDRAPRSSADPSRPERRQWQRAEPTPPAVTNPQGIQREESLQQRLAERAQRRAQPHAESPPRSMDRQTRQDLQRRGSSADTAREAQTIRSISDQRANRAEVQRKAVESRANREAVAGPRPSPHRDSQERALARESGGARAFGPRPPPRHDPAAQPQARQGAQPRFGGNQFERRERAERTQPRESRSDRGGQSEDRGHGAERGGQPGPGRESR